LVGDGAGTLAGDTAAVAAGKGSALGTTIRDVRGELAAAALLATASRRMQVTTVAAAPRAPATPNRVHRTGPGSTPIGIKLDVLPDR
jgi:hypothetical protein